jgi:hypothetical protein
LPHVLGFVKLVIQFNTCFVFDFLNSYNYAYHVFVCLLACLFMFCHMKEKICAIKKSMKCNQVIVTRINCFGKSEFDLWEEQFGLYLSCRRTLNYRSSSPENQKLNTRNEWLVEWLQFG